MPLHCKSGKFQHNVNCLVSFIETIERINKQPTKEKQNVSILNLIPGKHTNADDTAFAEQSEE